MGPLVWLVGAAVGFFAARLIDFGRIHFLAELFISGSGAFTAGIAATWLDFGGISEPDLRAGVFCALVAFVSIGLTRLAAALFRLQTSRRDPDPSAE